MRRHMRRLRGRRGDGGGGGGPPDLADLMQAAVGSSITAAMAGMVDIKKAAVYARTAL